MQRLQLYTNIFLTPLSLSESFLWYLWVVLNKVNVEFYYRQWNTSIELSTCLIEYISIVDAFVLERLENKKSSYFLLFIKSSTSLCTLAFYLSIKIEKEIKIKTKKINGALIYSLCVVFDDNELRKTRRAFSFKLNFVLCFCSSCHRKYYLHLVSWY